MSKKIIDYQVLSSEIGVWLAKEVKAAIAEGWQPLEGIVMALNGDGTYYAQAMVKYEGEE